MTRRRTYLSLACNVLLVAMVIIVWLLMAFGEGAGAFAARGIASLKYFTVISNLLLAVSCAVYACALVTQLRSPQVAFPHYAHTLKLIGTVAVTVTFMTVICFLGPVFGFGVVFDGVNFWFHVVIPLIAIVEFVALDGFCDTTFRDSLLAIVPVLIYGIFYYGNILLNGIGTRPDTNDWYGFAMAGLDKAIFIFAGMLLATWVFALVLRALNRRLARKTNERR